MVKRINLPEKVMDETSYEKLIGFLKGLKNQYVVLLKDIVYKADNKEYLIEKGSLVQINDILLNTISSDDEIQSYVCSNISINLLENDHSIKQDFIIYRIDADKFEKLSKLKNEKLSEGCLNSLKDCCQFIVETFGSTSEIEKISNKLNHIQIPTIITISSILTLCLISFILNVFNVINNPIITALGVGFLIFIVVEVVMFYLDGITEKGNLKLYDSYISDKRLKKWAKYDKQITDYAKNIDKQNLLTDNLQI